MLNKNYILLWLGQLVSQLGNRIYLMALAWYFVATLNSNSGLFVLFIISSLPSLLLGVFAGPLVERWKKKSILVWCDILSGILTAILAFLVYINSASALTIYIVCFLLNTINLLFSPSVNSIFPFIVSEKHFQKGLSYLKMITFLGQILGAAVGGILVGIWGVIITIAVNSISFFVSAIFESLITYKEEIKKTAHHYLVEMKEGFSYIKQNLIVMRLIIISIGANLFIPVLVVSLPMLIKDSLGLDAIHYGTADAMLPIGAITAAIYLSFRKSYTQKPLRILGFCLVLLSICFFAVASLKFYSVILFVMFAYGVLTNFVNIQVITWLMKNIDMEYRGRFFSLFESSSYASISLSYVLATTLSSNYSITTIFIVNGCGILLLAMFSLYWVIFSNKNTYLNHD